MARRTKVKSFPSFAAPGNGPVNTLPVRAGPIPVRRIVGSVDKADRLTPNFLPIDEQLRSPRFRSVQQALKRGVELPPIEVYALYRDYYVIDGHNRVAAAIANGVHYLDALVHECVLPEYSPENRLANERMRFERRTGLSRIHFTQGTSYARLLEELLAYREQLRSSDPTISLRDAARRWYREVFVPIAEPIDLGATVLALPGRTVSDLYLAVRDHQEELTAQRGAAVTMEEALTDFQALHARPLPSRVFRPLQRHARRALWRFTGGPPAS